MTILMTFFPIAITVFDGLKGTKREMEELLFTYGCNKKGYFFKAEAADGSAAFLFRN